jgi:ribosomal protein S18 acetylase RimI-like enzyme
MVGRVTDALPLAVANASRLWTAVGTARDGRVEQRDGYLAVWAGRSPLRIVTQSSTPDVASLTALAAEAAKVVVEDAYNTVDLSEIGLTARQLPVMIRDRGPALPAPTLPVTHVGDAELPTAERMVVHDFALDDFHPYREGEAFPAKLLTQEGVRLYLIDRADEVAGACLTVTNDGGGGIYWVTTAEAHRSQGVGRQLMHAVLADMAGLPITLTAASAGRALYDSLGFEVITPSTWWM